MTETQENQEAQENTDTSQTQESDGKDGQRALSWLGRMEKDNKTFQTTVLEKLEGLGQAKGPEKSGDAQKDELNEKLYDLYMSGKPLEAQKLIDQINRDSRTNLENMHNRQLKEALSKVDDPLMDTIGKDVEAMAAQLVKEGTRPAQAVRTAKAEVENALLRKQFIDGSGGKGLGLLSATGTRKTETPTGGLPKDLQAACERDIADGKFKDEAEFLKYLDPRIKARHGVK